MKFENSLALFNHLLMLGEERFEDNLAEIITTHHPFYNDVKKYYSAHLTNKNETVFKSLITDKASVLVEDNSIHHLEGQQLGYYQLIKKLGQGGMGVVYLAKRNDSLLEQQVAIKFVYPSIAALAGDTFLSKEAQHLANLQHPNIAHIYTIDNYEFSENTGNELTKIPYMIMEYIDGISIDKFCEENKLNLQQRLNLFIKVCTAVNAAHQNMILHADIKPSNILVDKSGEPKLMDFGIARSLNTTTEINENDRHSIEEQFNAASSNFASPEQLQGKRLSTTSDVYSLGKLLESLLINIKINDELTSIYKNTQQKNPKDRLPEVSKLIDLIQRYINKKPVLTYSKKWNYFIYKYIQRNKYGLIFSILALSTFGVGAYKFINEQIKLAISEKENETIVNFVTTIFNSTDPEKNGKTTLNSVLKSSTNYLISTENIQAKNKISLLYTLAQTVRNNGDTNTSIKIYDQIFSIYHQKNLPLDKNYYEYKVSKAIALVRTEQYQAALNIYKEVLSTGIDFWQEDIRDWASILSNMSNAYLELKQYDLALKYVNQALTIDKKLFGEQHIKIAIRYNIIADIYLRTNKLNKSYDYEMRAIKIKENLYGKNTRKLTINYRALGRILGAQQKYSEASQYFKKSFDIDKNIYPENHLRYLYSLSSYISSLITERKYSMAKQLLDKINKILKKYSIHHTKLIKATKINQFKIDLVKNNPKDKLAQLNLFSQQLKLTDNEKNQLIKFLKN